MFNFDPLSPEFQANPYPYYHLLRAHLPAMYFEAWGAWFFSAYADCSMALKDPRLGREMPFNREEHPERFFPIPDHHQPFYDVANNFLLLRDPPTHTRLKGLVHKAFTPRRIEQLRTDIQRIADDLLDAVSDGGKMDLVEAFAFPLPITVIEKLLGVPAGDRADFRRWTAAIVPTLELTTTPEQMDAAADACLHFSAYLRALMAERRPTLHTDRHQDDLMTALLAAEEQGDHLTEDELIGTVILLLVAGHETTVNLIGSGTLALLRHPEQVARLRADPALVRNAVEEMLRYDGPVQLTARWATQDFALETAGGTIEVKHGHQIITLLGAANRDPAVFSDPDVFDVARKGADRHLGFGMGIHYCVGAPLARMEGEIAFTTLLRRLPALALAGDAPPAYRPSYVLRGLQSLPVVF